MDDNISCSLQKAVKEANLRSVKNLVNRYGLSYHEGWRNGHVFLYDAVKMGHLEIAKFLLEKGAEVNHNTANGDTLLHLAVEKNYEEVVELLLERNVLVDAMNEMNKTALHLAVEKGYAEVVQILLNNNASMMIRSIDGLTPLDCAVSSWEKETIARMLLHRVFSATPFEDKEKGLNLLQGYLSDCSAVGKKLALALVAQVVALHNNRRDFVDGLMKRGLICSREFVDEFQIGLVIEKYYLTILEQMTPGETRFKFWEGFLDFYLHVAVKMRFVKVVRLLLKVGFNANAKDQKGKTCLYYALPNIQNCLEINCECEFEYEYVEILKSLFDSGADIKEEPRLLHLAIYRRFVRVCRFLIKNGADVNGLDSEEKTPLLAVTTQPHLCGWCKDLQSSFKHKSAEIAQLLLENGADLMIKPPNGRLAFHNAARCEMTETVRVFLDYGVNVDLREAYGRTPLHYAAGESSYETVKMLCERGADVNSCQKNGWRPVHFAASEGWVRNIKILAEFGADMNARGSRGETPLHCIHWGAESTLNDLLGIGCDINLIAHCGATVLDTSINIVETEKSYRDPEVLYKYLDKFNSEDNQ